ncbi:Inactive TPR repeat-containing thioredoxin TTL3 [Vitis vinifera]|uniref:Inactive TPR repeat-containing thioredoxin TTL3 n=1 Tax=Vitis vinifera TaxID=29760 RepID=A0A438FC44_VITVI|nr:Inactive TPR repeat-containing thioredoxin TTL3 [Vitis vinifera]
MGCKVGKLLTTCLGLLLGAPFKSPSMWDGVEESSIEGASKRHHLEKWSSMCKDKKLEGYVLRFCPLLIKSCLEMVLEIALEREFLWRRVIVGKFGEEPRGWCSLARREGYGVGLWKVIRGGWEAFKLDRGISFSLEGSVGLLGAFESRTINESLANPLWKCKGSLTFIVFSLWLSWVLPFSMKDLLKGQGNNSERNAVLGPIIGGPFTLIDAKHQLVTEQNLLGNWVLLYFGCTSSPDVGPEQVQMMAKAIDFLESKQNVRVLPVFITIDPQRDSPSQLQAYLKEFDSRIVGLTGPDAAIRQMAQEYRVYFRKVEEDGDDYLVESSHNIVQCRGVVTRNTQGSEEKHNAIAPHHPSSAQSSSPSGLLLGDSLEQLQSSSIANELLLFIVFWEKGQKLPFPPLPSTIRPCESKEDITFYDGAPFTRPIRPSPEDTKIRGPALKRDEKREFIPWQLLHDVVRPAKEAHCQKEFSGKGYRAMTEMVDTSPNKSSGCGLLNAVFGRRTFWLRRATSTGSLPSMNSINISRVSGTPSSKRRRGSSSDETSFLNQSNSSEAASGLGDKPIIRPSPSHTKTPPIYNQNQGRRSDEAIMQPSLRSGAMKMSQREAYVNQGRRVPREAIGISGELEAMIADHQSSKGNSSLVRASSSNVMLFSNLGNLRQPGTGNFTSNNVQDYLPKAAREETSMPNGKYSSSQMGNVVKKPNGEKEPPSSLCRALSTRMDPETLKIMAISIDPNKASYRSNKSAALTALGRLLEAVFECREALRIEPYYHRAHQRLGNLYLRRSRKAIYHFKHAGPESDPEDMAKAHSLQAHLSKCTEARRLRDWNTLVKEAGYTISAGADSAPQIYTLQAEALLKLHRHQEADAVLAASPYFSVDDCTKFFGPYGNANLLMIRAQVDLAAGRLDDAFEAAQKAARLDSNNKEVGIVVRRTRGVISARAKGNDLFKASRFSEACIAYGEGLDHDPFNSVLLCNRATCRSKLGQFEKAVEDCTAALSVRPSYSKARLRRADCNAKLGRCEASIQDYEVLMRETPEDEEVGKAMFEAQWGGSKQVIQFMEQLCKRYPSVNFLKVEVEEHPNIARSEGVSSLPAFKIYKNGSRVKEISGDNLDLLESTVKSYNT